MNEEFELNNTEDEGQPGSLGSAFDGFSPDPPPDSWERLSDRRKKRRRFLLWWWLPALILVGGFSTWLWVNNRGEKVDGIQSELAIEQRIRPIRFPRTSTYWQW